MIINTTKVIGNNVNTDNIVGAFHIADSRARQLLPTENFSSLGNCAF